MQIWWELNHAQVQPRRHVSTGVGRKRLSAASSPDGRDHRSVLFQWLGGVRRTSWIRGVRVVDFARELAELVDFIPKTKDECLSIIRRDGSLILRCEELLKPRYGMASWTRMIGENVLDRGQLPTLG